MLFIDAVHQGESDQVWDLEEWVLDYFYPSFSYTLIFDKGISIMSTLDDRKIIIDINKEKLIEFDFPINNKRTIDYHNCLLTSGYLINIKTLQMS